MGRGQLVQAAIAGLAGGVEDQGDVHHDVDEQALRPDERAKIVSPGVVAQSQRAPGGDQHLAQSLVAGRLEPGQKRVQEDEAQIVNVAVVLAMLQEPGVMLGGPPPLAVAGTIGDEPHHAGVKAPAPVRPELAAMQPASAHGIDREIVGRPFDRTAHLTRGEIECSLQPGLQ